MATTSFNIARALENLHRYKEAFEHAKRAVNIAKYISSTSHPQVQIFEQDLNRIQRKL
jgi:hypothetical protein